MNWTEALSKPKPTACGCGEPFHPEGVCPKCHRVTDFRVDVVTIDEARFYALPAEVLKLFRAYGTSFHSPRPGVIQFEISISRWAEILPLLEAK